MRCRSQQGLADSGRRNDQTDDRSDGCGDSQKRELEPEVIPSRKRSSDRTTCCDETKKCPEADADDDCHRIGVLVGDWCADYEKAGRSNDSAEQPDDSAQPSAANSQHDQRRDTEHERWYERDRRSCDEQSCPVPP